jgi:DNA-binding GntR family transcriptional regulator
MQMGQQASQVRQDILDRVLTRRLLPGDRIDEDDIRDRLGLSGTPIREALISLEASGVIERRPRHGAFITALDLEGLIKSVELLAETEAAVAFRAAQRINSHQAAELQATAKDCLDFVQDPSRFDVEYYDLNMRFHRALITAAGNEYLEQAVLQVSSRLIAYLACQLTLPGEARKSAEEHFGIVQAVLDADGDTARELMIRHVTFGDTRALDVLNTMSG